VTSNDAVARPDGLSEEARQRVVLIAADVLGRLPADEVPPALRQVARFTPAKRARLGSAALLAALDADEVFRAKVGDLVAEATPQLVQAVRTGAPTTASDPVDVAVVAYLDRPDGWQQALAAANSRATSERTPAGAGADVEQLRTEAAQLRSQARSEPARVRAAVAAATAELSAEVSQLRGLLRARTSEVRSTERARDQLADELDQARSAADGAAAAADAEARRLRNRITELERAATSARGQARAARDVDEARLWLLVDTLTEAAAGIRRELALPATAVRPADAIGTPAEPAGQRRRASDAADLDRLLALPNVHLLVDGYNVTKTGYPSAALADQRSRLVTAMAALTARSGVEATVVFDGAQRPAAQPPVPRGVRVLFSDPDEIADDLIRRLVSAEPPGRPVVVVTSDEEIVADVLAAGGWAVPSAVLLALLG
jgi:YacP-like NYN domain-containing protein